MQDIARVIGVQSSEDLGVDPNLLPVIQNVITVPGVSDTTNVGNSSTVQESSQHVAFASVVTNAAASTNIQMTLAPGLWRFNVHMSQYTNWINTLAALNSAELRIGYGLGIIRFISFYAAGTAAVPAIIAETRTADILIPVQSTVTCYIEGNGVGQTTIAAWDILVQRLL